MIFSQLRIQCCVVPTRSTYLFIQIAEPAVNTETNLATSTTSSSILTGNSRTNVTEVHNSLNAPDPCPPRQLQSAFDSVAQRNFTALMREPPIALPSCISGYIVESLESTNNSRLALEQGITRAAVRIRRVMEEREERELLSNF